MRRSLLILIVALLLTGLTPLAVTQPPPVPMTVYGYVFIQTVDAGNITAPVGLYVYAEVDTTKISNTTTEADGYYIIAITGPAEGTLVDLWVQDINVTRITLQYMTILELNLTVVDTESPAITIISPTPGATVTAPLWINATLSDNLAINTTTITLTLNTTTKTPTYNPTTGLLYYKTTTLTQGLYIINLTAKDLAGKLAIKSWNFTVTPSILPELSIEGCASWYWINDTTITSVVAGDVDSDGSPEIVTGGYYYDDTRKVAQLAVWNGSTLELERVTTWYWTGNTTITSVAIGDVDSDGETEIVTAGCYHDGVRKVAQLAIWNGTTLSLENVTVWYWVGDTCINSVAIGDIDHDGTTEVITAGYYHDGTSNVAQLAVWNGQTLSLERITVWYWVGETPITSVAIGDVDGDALIEIVTGGYYYDDTREVAQLAVWNGSTLELEGVTAWYWVGDTRINSVAVGDVDGDGSAEIITGGYYHSGVKIAQLATWDGATLSLENVTGWSWIGDTRINSVAIGDVDGDGSVEIVTGGSYHDGTYDSAQLVVWDGSDLTLETVTAWRWVGDTRINSVAVGDVDGDGDIEIVTGGSYHDGTRTVAQLTVWIITSV